MIDDDRTPIEKHWYNIALVLVIIMTGVFVFNTVPFLSLKGLLFVAELIMVLTAMILFASGHVPNFENKSKTQLLLYSLFLALPSSISFFSMAIFDETEIWKNLDIIHLVGLYVLFYISFFLAFLLSFSDEMGIARETNRN
jgi:hypothetical protein